MNSPIPVSIPVPSSTERLLAVLAHLSPVVGLPLLPPLILFLVQRGKSAFVAGHALLALGVQSAVLALTAAGWFALKMYVESLPPSSGDFGFGRVADLLLGLMVCLGPLALLYLVVTVVCTVQAGRGRWFATPR